MLIKTGETSGGTRTNEKSAPTDFQRPLVTVITAVFNGADCIGDCIESVLLQDYPGIEHIILDACSTDGTIDILRSYDDRLALWVSEPDHGVFDAWNKGLELAQGEWVAFLGADDRFLPGAVREFMDLADRNPEAEFLSSRARLDHPSGYAPVFGGPWEWPRFTRRMTTVHVGSMHRKALFSEYGKFDASYRIAGDFEFLLRARGDLRTAYTPAITVVMKAGGLSDSTKGLHEAKRAKLQTGVRSHLRAQTDLLLDTARFHLRRTLIRLGIL